MDSTVICPDCGGVIGGDGRDGRKPCTCDDQPAATRPGMPDPVVRPRVCCKCGKDLAGKKRYRDSVGYWCEACHYAGNLEKKTNHVPCDQCGRYVEPDKLTPYENIRICSRCLRERQSQSRKIRRPVVLGSEHRAQERRRLVNLVLLAGLLALIIILASAGLL